MKKVLCFLISIIPLLSVSQDYDQINKFINGKIFHCKQSSTYHYFKFDTINQLCYEEFYMKRKSGEIDFISKGVGYKINSSNIIELSFSETSSFKKRFQITQDSVLKWSHDMKLDGSWSEPNFDGLSNRWKCDVYIPIIKGSDGTISVGEAFRLNQEKNKPEPISDIPGLEKPIYDNLEKQIAYIEKFEHWTHFLDHFETKQEINNFFGPHKWDHQGLQHNFNFYSLKKATTSYYGGKSYTSGTASYNDLTNSINYNTTTDSYEGGSVTTSYVIKFYYWKNTLPPYDQVRVHQWKVSKGLENISNKKFIKLIKKAYTPPKKEPYQYKRKG